MTANADNELLGAALVGYQAQLRTIDEKVQELRSQIGGKAPKGAVVSDGATPKRRMSAGGKARIAAAQKKRWAVFHKEKAPRAPAKKTRKKRVLSSAAKKHIGDVTRKRWAEYRAKKAVATA